MNDAVDSLLVARDREPDKIGRMVGWSVAAHVALVLLVVYMPESWRGAQAEIPRTVMTISLGGAPGPRAGGMTQMGGRPVQTVAEQPVRRAEAPPAPKPPAMALPSPPARPRPRPVQAPQDATGRTPTTGAEPEEGSARADTGARGQGFGLATGGGAARAYSSMLRTSAARSISSRWSR